MLHHPTFRASVLYGAAITAALLLLGSAPASAKIDIRKRYEAELIRWGLDQAGLERDPAPQGKRIERIVIVREDVIAESDPWPTLLNIVHVKTRDYIVRQELLVKEGDLWDGELVAESARNLRSLFILAVARAVPCRSKTPGKVVLLVVTKDLWSIRLNIIFNQTGLVLHNFDITPTEGNFLGRNKRLSLHLGVSEFDFGGPAVRDYVALGARYSDGRLFGSRLYVSSGVDLYVDGKVPCGGLIGDQHNAWCPTRQAGEIAGVAASVSVGRPLYSLASKWGFSASASVDVRQRRRMIDPDVLNRCPYREFVNVRGDDGQLTKVPCPRYRATDANLVLNTIQLGELEIPRIYDGRRLESSIGFTRRFGGALKHDVSWGLSSYRLEFTAPKNFPFGPEAETLYEASLPRSETAAAFYVSYGMRSSEYIRLRNVQTFALSEDFRIGPSLSVGASFAENLVRSSHSFITLSGSAGYTWYFADALLTISGSASTRIQPTVDVEGRDAPLVNSQISGGVRNISPILGIGRLHTQVSLLLREDSLDNAYSVLGGASLRGLPDEYLEGRNVFRVNSEFRSLPINLFTLHLGFVAFYDGGSAFGSPYTAALSQAAIPFAYHHTVGFGARGHFPQFDRESLRVDVGFPIPSGVERFRSGVEISLAFGQVF